MINLVGTDSGNQHFKNLVQQLDAYLAVTDGAEHSFYNQFNGIEHLKHVVVAYSETQAVSCGAIKPFDTVSVETKRMFTLPEFRGHGIASMVLKELELWGKEMGFQRMVLETGKRQLEAVNFYKKCNYRIIPNYPPYINMANSICFEKLLH